MPGLHQAHGAGGSSIDTTNWLLQFWSVELLCEGGSAQQTEEEEDGQADGSVDAQRHAEGFPCECHAGTKHKAPKCSPAVCRGGGSQSAGGPKSRRAPAPRAGQLLAPGDGEGGLLNFSTYWPLNSYIPALQYAGTFNADIYALDSSTTVIRPDSIF